jgi:hypothetical protein
MSGKKQNFSTRNNKFMPVQMTEKCEHEKNDHWLAKNASLDDDDPKSLATDFDVA